MLRARWQAGDYREQADFGPEVLMPYLTPEATEVHQEAMLPAGELGKGTPVAAPNTTDSMLAR